jgi:hypothetical protein
VLASVRRLALPFPRVLGGFREEHAFHGTTGSQNMLFPERASMLPRHHKANDSSAAEPSDGHSDAAS